MNRDKIPYASNSIIALVMLQVFINLSHGKSLIVTFVPGVIFSYMLCLYLIRFHKDLSCKKHLFVIFLVALAVQFLHFGEEFSTEFYYRFPKLYGGETYSTTSFVTVNMISYALFLVSSLSIFSLNSSILLMPFIFFVVYGVCGNAIAHSYWSFDLEAYFPGLYTSFLYWILGPVLLYLILGSKKGVAIFMGTFAIVLITLLKVFMI
ncbi:MAG: hypothetical protein K9K67_14405 [Bacteriovoracaceae bacterium]|nr:hypothetical protein [Bacteriovoracaceae bacterium]